MAKRLVAFLMVLVLGLSMVSVVALAEPANPDCQHPGKSTQSKTTYTPYSISTHKETTRTVTVCDICHDEVSIPVITTAYVAHTCGWQKWHDFTTSTHHFKKFCRYCRQEIESHSFYCTGNPHVSYPTD